MDAVCSVCHEDVGRDGYKLALGNRICCMKPECQDFYRATVGSGDTRKVGLGESEPAAKTATVPPAVVVAPLYPGWVPAHRRVDLAEKFDPLSSLRRRRGPEEETTDVPVLVVPPAVVLSGKKSAVPEPDPLGSYTAVRRGGG